MKDRYFRIEHWKALLDDVKILGDHSGIGDLEAKVRLSNSEVMREHIMGGITEGKTSYTLPPTGGLHSSEYILINKISDHVKDICTDYC